MKNNIDKKLKGKSIAVTGGYGFIGSHLVRKLLELKVKRIIIIDSLEYGTLENLEKDKRIIFIKHRLGTDNPRNLLIHLIDVDYLFHLAAEKHNQSKDSPKKVQQSNILGTFDLLDIAVQAGIKKVVFSSSLYTYGRLNKPKFKESDIPTPHTIYGITKLTGEHLLHFFAKKYNLQYIVLRYLFVYGPNQYSGMGYKSVIVSNFNKILENKRPIINGDGKQTYDYIYVSDVVDATIQSMVCNMSGEIFNIGSSRPITIKQLTTHMLAVAKSHLSPVYNPPDWTAGTYRVGDTNKVKKFLGFQPKVKLTEGLARTYNWLKENRSDNR
ncbi:MAG: NAD-dependent epimerase/dehydratase family protein [Patescibacteria group bacterium]